MKRFLKICSLSLMFLTPNLLGSEKDLEAAKSEYDENVDNFVFIEKREGPISLQNVVVAFDTESKQFKWKDFSLQESMTDWKWKTIEKGDVDPVLRDIANGEEIDLLANHEDVYFNLRKIGGDVGIDLGFKLKGGGPVLAAVCGITCKIINSAGCGAGAFLIGSANIGVGILYASVCAMLDTAGAAGCMSLCLALPTP